MTKSKLIARIVISSVALFGWLLLFSTGLLIDSTKYRNYLASPTGAAQTTASTQQPAPTEAYTGTTVGAFFKAIVCFTPTNLLILTLLGGLLGGCSSNFVAHRLSEQQAMRADPRQLGYLEENPWSAMMRSFIVYLCVIAGLYFAIDDPFKTPTAAQYMRLAGTLSILAFVVGYDPSRIEQWIGIVPNPNPSQVVTVRGGKNGVQLTAAQGPVATRTATDDTELSMDLRSIPSNDDDFSSLELRKSAQK